MPELPSSPIQVVGPDDYTLLVVVDPGGHARVLSKVENRATAEWLTDLAVEAWRQVDGARESADQLAATLTADGWLPASTCGAAADAHCQACGACPGTDHDTGCPAPTS